MHVLMIPSWYPTPNNPLHGSFFRDQVQALQKAGLQLGVIFPHFNAPRLLLNPFAWHKIGLRQENDAGVPTYRHSVYRWSDDLRSLSENWLSKGEELFAHYLKKEGRPDLILANAAHRAGLLAHRISKKHNIPFVIHEHQAHYVREPRPQWVKDQLKEAFSAASRRLVVSEKYGEILEEIFGESFAPWTFVPNAIGQSFLSRSLPAVAEPARAARLLSIGNLIEHKGQDYLLRAFIKCAKEHKDWTLTFLGDGPLRPSLEEMAQAAGLSDRVIFRGNVGREKVIKEIDECTFYVHGSPFETFGVVLAEALARGKPVVSTACCGPESIVTENDGLLVPVGDEEAMVKAMEKMAEGHSSYSKEELRERAVARFGPEQVAAQLIKVFQSVLSPR